MKLALGRPIDHGWGLIEETAAERSGRRNRGGGGEYGDETETDAGTGLARRDRFT